MTTPYADEVLEKYKAEIDGLELFLRDVYPQSDREVEIISKARLVATRVDYLYNKLIATQKFVKLQAARNIRMAGQA